MAITGPFQSSRHWCFVMIENVDKRFDGRTNLAEPYGVIAKNSIVVHPFFSFLSKENLSTLDFHTRKTIVKIKNTVIFYYIFH